MHGNLRNIRHFPTLATFGFVSGHDFSRAVKAQTKSGFSPCAFFRLNTCNCKGTARQNRQTPPSRGSSLYLRDTATSFVCRLPVPQKTHVAKPPPETRTLFLG